jgi:hypothetical protein
MLRQLCGVPTSMPARFGAPAKKQRKRCHRAVATVELRQKRSNADVAEPEKTFDRIIAATQAGEAAVVRAFNGHAMSLTEIVALTLSSAPITLRWLQRPEERGVPLRREDVRWMRVNAEVDEDRPAKPV